MLISVYLVVSSNVEFQRWWVLKSKIFGQESTYSKDPSMNYGSSTSAKIVLSKSIFDVKNINVHKYLSKLDYSLVNFQYNGNQRKDKENMPSKEFDKILFDFYIPLVGK